MGVKKLVLDAFPSRLREAGRPDLVYADPPFGTGSDFGWYADDHSNWKTWMSQVMSTLNQVVSDTGSVWLHLDDVHSAWARLAAVETMPDLTYLGSIAWERTYSPRATATGLTKVHDSILVFGRPGFALRPLAATDDQSNWFVAWDGDQPWSSADLSAPRADANPDLVYAIQSPVTGRWHYPRAGRHWIWGVDAMRDALQPWGAWSIIDRTDAAERANICAPTAPGNGLGLAFDGDRGHVQAVQSGILPSVMFGRTGTGGPRRKSYDSGSVRLTDFWPHEQVGHIQSARADLAADVPGASFTTPKPVKLMRRIIESATDPGDLVLDPFAGSGTTAATAHRLGRNFVTYESNERVAESLTIPRLRAALSGHNPLIDKSLVHRLPYKVHAGEPSRAAEVIRALVKDGRLDLDADLLTSLSADLRATDRTTSTSHSAATVELEVIR